MDKCDHLKHRNRKKCNCHWHDIFTFIVKLTTDLVPCSSTYAETVSKVYEHVLHCLKKQWLQPRILSSWHWETRHVCKRFNIIYHLDLMLIWHMNMMLPFYFDWIMIPQVKCSECWIIWLVTMISHDLINFFFFWKWKINSSHRFDIYRVAYWPELLGNQMLKWSIEFKDEKRNTSIIIIADWQSIADDVFISIG